MVKFECYSRYDGSVTLKVSEKSDYEVYRSADGVTFQWLGRISGGDTFFDPRPDALWKKHSFSEPQFTYFGNWKDRPDPRFFTGTARQTTQSGARCKFAFTGRRIGLVGVQVGREGGTRYDTSIGITLNGRAQEKVVDLSTYPYVGNEYFGMMLWGHDFKSPGAHTVEWTVKTCKTLAVTLDYCWVDTAAATIAMGTPGYYKVVETRSRQEAVASVVPRIEAKAYWQAHAHKMMDFQKTFPGQVIPAKSEEGTLYGSAYPQWVTCAFGAAYYLLGDPEYKAAMDRQWEYARSRRASPEGNVRHHTQDLYFPDYDARYSNQAYWLWKMFADPKYLREAESVADSCIARFGGLTLEREGTTFHPMVEISVTGDYQFTLAEMFAQLWADPSSTKYHDPLYESYAANHTRCARTLQYPSGEIAHDYSPGLNAGMCWPDGNYSSLSAMGWDFVNKVFRDLQGKPKIPELSDWVAKADQWELFYSSEPMLQYNACYETRSNWVTQNQRLTAAYQEWRAGRLDQGEYRVYLTGLFTACMGAHHPPIGMCAWYAPLEPGCEDVPLTPRRGYDIAFGMWPLCGVIAFGVPTDWFMLET